MDKETCSGTSHLESRNDNVFLQSPSDNLGMVYEDKNPGIQTKEEALIHSEMTLKKRREIHENWERFIEVVAIQGLLRDVKRRDKKIEAIEKTGWFNDGKMSNNEIMRFIEGTEQLKLGIIRIPKDEQVADRSVNITFVSKEGLSAQADLSNLSDIHKNVPGIIEAEQVDE